MEILSCIGFFKFSLSDRRTVLTTGQHSKKRNRAPLLTIRSISRKVRSIFADPKPLSHNYLEKGDNTLHIREVVFLTSMPWQGIGTAWKIPSTR